MYFRTYGVKVLARIFKNCESSNRTRRLSINASAAAGDRMTMK